MKKVSLLLLMVFGMLLTVEAQGRRVYDDNENTYDAVGYDSYGNMRSAPRTERRAYYDDDAYDSRDGYDSRSNYNSRNSDYYDDRNVPQRRNRTYVDDAYYDDDSYSQPSMVPKGSRVVYSDNDRTYDAVGVDKEGELRSIPRNGKYYRNDREDLMSLYRNNGSRGSQKSPDRRRSYDDYYDE